MTSYFTFSLRLHMIIRHGGPSSFNGLSFLPYDNGTYVQAPFEDISKDEFESFSQHIKSINLENVREIEDNTDLQGELACSGGSCEVF